MNIIFKKLPLLSLITSIFLILLTLVLIFTFEKVYENKIYPNVFVGKVNFSGFTKNEVKNYFDSQKTGFEGNHVILNFEGKEWAVNGEKLGIKFDSDKLANSAYDVGRKNIVNIISKFVLLKNKTEILPEYKINEKYLDKFLQNIEKEVNIAPVDAVLNFEGERVSVFQLSKKGRKIETEKLKSEIISSLLSSHKITHLKIETIEVSPKLENDAISKFGIKELIGSGISYFFDSIPSRIHNIKLAASKFNGVLIKPNETFSFLKSVGSITKLDGYQEAYVIVSGKTVLGDGGGVCQVSTTMYRAALYSGLPVVERTAHSYRVPYYEPPLGLDATIYQPGGPDLKFKNDTKHHILIQTFFDEENQSLTFSFFGTSDGRVAQISDPVVVSTSPPPPTRYQDDPTLPKGVEKQIDTAHPGAKVYFTRKVTRDNEVLIDEKIWSNFVPWAAVVLRGTK